jgi:hypothetical protein
MNYELAKQLKDSGFPFRRIEAGMCMSRESADDVIDFNPSGDSSIGAQHFFKPTLEELIEKLGGAFRAVYREERLNVSFIAVCPQMSALSEGEIGNITATGSTAVEAVAHLWLALNEKK